MKTSNLFRILNLIGFLIVLSCSTFAQTTHLKNDAKQDSLLIERLITKANIQSAANKDTNLVTHKWVSGKILYTHDASLKATQLIAAPDTFTTIIQYAYRGNVHEQRFDYTDLANYALNSIYRLPDNKPSYLFLLSKTENQPDYEGDDWLKDFNKPYSPPKDTDLKHIKNLTYVAVVLRLVKDSLVEVHFPPSKTDDDNTPAEETINPADSVSAKITSNADTNSFGFISYIKQTGKIVTPYLRYDSLKHTLSFLDVGCKLCDGSNDAEQPVSDVETGSYRYKDTSFVLVSDTSYYYPSLPELDTIVAHRTYKIGKYIIKAEAVEGYEEGYGGYFHATLTKTYRVGNQTLIAFNNDEWDKIDLKPGHRVQKNGSLILLLQDATNGHGPGECGSASYIEPKFWLVDGRRSKQLFSFSYGSCNSNVSYTFTKNGKEITDRFYLISPSDGRFDSDYNSYWKDASTYVFVFNNEERSLSRNFYLHFNVIDKTNPIKLTIGKLYKTKHKTPKKGG